MYPFSYTGLRLIHDEKVRDAMERVCVDAELAREPRRTRWLSLPGRMLWGIRNKPHVFTTPHSPTISSRP
jgi:hypothetical protein